VNTIFEEITDAWRAGQSGTATRFGAFSVKKRDAQNWSNPRTGETVPVD